MIDIYIPGMIRDFGVIFAFVLVSSNAINGNQIIEIYIW